MSLKKTAVTQVGHRASSVCLSGLSARVAKVLAVAALAAAIGGCDTVGDYLNLRNSFLNPSEVGRFDKENPFGYRSVKPVKWPILDQLDVIEDQPDEWANATDPTPADLVPEIREYGLAAGDGIDVSIYELQQQGLEWDKQVRVNELGYINIQNLGNILVTGLTPTQLEQKIAQLLIENKILPAQPGPQVSVTLLDSRQKVFSFLGGVGAPGTYTIIQPDFRILDAIAMAHDIPPQSGLDYIYVIRQGLPNPNAAVPGMGGGTSWPPASGAAGVPATAAPGTAIPGAAAPAGPPSGRSPLDDLESIQKQVETQPTPTAPASAPASGPGATGPRFIRSLPTAMVVSSGAPGGNTLAAADIDAALGVPETTSAPASEAAPVPSSPAAMTQGDHALLDKAAESQPTEQVYVDGKWVSVASTQGAAATAEAATTPGAGAVASTMTTAVAATGEADTGYGEAGAQRVIRIPLSPLFHGVSKYNIVIRPGDIIRVPSVDPGEFYMMGHIGRPGVYTMTGRKITLKQAVASGGNLDALAIPRRCDLIRRVGPDQEVTIQVNLQKIFDGTQPDIFLKANDILNIGTDAISPFLAVTRNAYRASYGWGFVYDKNLNSDTNTNNGAE